MTGEEEFRSRIARMTRIERILTIQKVVENAEEDKKAFEEQQQLQKQDNTLKIMPSIDGIQKSIHNFQKNKIEEEKKYEER